jgi:hypothetical protein
MPKMLFVGIALAYYGKARMTSVKSLMLLVPDALDFSLCDF